MVQHVSMKTSRLAVLAPDLEDLRQTVVHVSVNTYDFDGPREFSDSNFGTPDLVHCICFSMCGKRNQTGREGEGGRGSRRDAENKTDEGPTAPS